MSSAHTEKRDALAKLRIKRSDDPPAGSRRSRNGWVILCLALLTLAAGGVFWWGSDSIFSWIAVPDAMKSRTEVRIARVTVETGRTADATVVATGYLMSLRQAKIGARAPGRIETIGVEEGTRVTKDQTLAVLEHADMDAALAATQAMVQQTKAELAEQEVEIERTKSALDRAESLRIKSGISAADFDQSKFQHAAAVVRRESLKAAIVLAEARVREAEQLRENMFIRASFDGTVISKDAEVGESILPGGMGEASGRGSVVTIADLDHLEVECDVKEDFISRVSAGRSAEVAVDAVLDRRYQGRVRKIIPMGDRARATIKVKVEILDADSRLFPEMSATVYFLPDNEQVVESEEPRIFCPTSAIVAEGDNKFVFVVDENDRASRVEITTTGADRDGRTEVATGLSGSERCIADPPAGIRAGDLLKIVE